MTLILSASLCREKVDLLKARGFRFGLVISGLINEPASLLLVADDLRTAGAPVVLEGSRDMINVSLRFDGSEEVLDVDETDDVELVLRLLPTKLPGTIRPLWPGTGSWMNMIQLFHVRHLKLIFY